MTWFVLIHLHKSSHFLLIIFARPRMHMWDLYLTLECSRQNSLVALGTCGCLIMYFNHVLALSPGISFIVSQVDIDAQLSWQVCFVSMLTHLGAFICFIVTVLRVICFLITS